MIGIYKITNKINGKSYIGQSVNIEKRIYTHFWAAYQPQLPSYHFQIYQAIRKYGKENFSIEILNTIPNYDKDKLNELEEFYIAKYDSFTHGYNMTTGGSNSEQNINSNERNGHAKLNKQDVIDIRQAYARHENKQKVYAKYKNRIGESGFDKIWSWSTWKNILPELRTEESQYYYTHQAKRLSSEQAALNAGILSKEQVINIRELATEGIPYVNIQKILNLPIQIDEISAIVRKEKFSSIK